jgi:hypothetical protein
MFRVFTLAIIVLIASCNNKKGPDVSDIKVDVPVQRFEKDLFAIDTNNIATGLDALQKKYPQFLPDYLQFVLGVSNPAEVEQQVKFFITQSKGLLDSAQKKYADFSAIQNDFTTAFKYVKYYYPTFSVPKIITLIGPVDALAKLGETYTPNFLRPGFLGVSLQFYLGNTFSLYQTDRYISEVAPLYISRRFNEEYIVPDAMKLIVDAVYSDTSAGRPLIEQMIERGKQWYLLDKFLPGVADSVKTGFTQKQLSWCTDNEGNIWAQITKNENIYSIEQPVLQNYLGEAPFTQNMPESSPGNIGQWVGLRIVQKFAENKDDLSVQEIVQTPAKTIFEEAKYKPK